MKNELEDSLLTDFFASNLKDEPHAGFEEEVMSKIEAELVQRKTVKPLIGKSTWFLIGFFTLLYFLVLFLSYNPLDFKNVEHNIYDKISILFQYVSPYWMGLVIAGILLWEFQIRRRLNFI